MATLLGRRRKKQQAEVKPKPAPEPEPTPEEETEINSVSDAPVYSICLVRHQTTDREQAEASFEALEYLATMGRFDTIKGYTIVMLEDGKTTKIVHGQKTRDPKVKWTDEEFELIAKRPKRIPVEIDFEAV